MRALSVSPVLDLNDPSFKDKDGDDGDSGDLSSIMIDIAANGYMLTLIYEDGSDQKSVYTDFNEMMKDIRSAH